jgi:hypothetical protein
MSENDLYRANKPIETAIEGNPRLTQDQLAAKYDISQSGEVKELKTIQNPAFEIIQDVEGKTNYCFKDLVVQIDTTGNNYKALPELIFVTSFNRDLKTGSLNQPDVAKQGVDMPYAIKCIQRVALETGMHRFWFFPYGGDTKKAENRERRAKARKILFEEALLVASPESKLSPAPEGHGYIVDIL